MSDLTITNGGVSKTMTSQGPVSPGVALGQNGALLITGTTAATPPAGQVFAAIQFLEDTVFNSAAGGLTGEDDTKWPSSIGTGTAIDADAGEDIDGVTFSAGTTIYGRWTSITLVSGKVIAYLG